ncbi:MAG: bifunctional phosphopantothenoylcysteine decarboxylase/phosphopantothenate--cysteine ligase CoaBC [Fimbriimonadaceae bacterium]
MGSVVLGVSGSVAAYRAADLARELMRAGFTVRVCLTDAAQNFVSPALFEALTGQPCLIDTFDEPDRGRMAHIDWARQAEVLVIAPATANTLNKLAQGVGDDMLTTLALAYAGPIVVAPAMNPSMYANEITQESLRKLLRRGVILVEPAEGDVACGEQGQGKLASIEAVVEAVHGAHRRTSLLQGKRVLITAGPTCEPIDSVRFVGNHSSGRMGAALAQAALLMGAEEVRVVSGPIRIPPPQKAQLFPVTTAEQMLAAALKLAPEADIVIGAAAVADYRPADPVKGKIRSGQDELNLRLVRNPDVIAEIAKVAKGKVVGFAAEPSNQLDAARVKLAAKGLYAIAVNDISRKDIGFEGPENELTLLFADGRTIDSGMKSKLACALWLLEEIAKGL